MLITSLGYIYTSPIYLLPVRTYVYINSHLAILRNTESLGVLFFIQFIASMIMNCLVRVSAEFNPLITTSTYEEDDSSNIMMNNMILYLIDWLSKMRGALPEAV